MELLGFVFGGVFRLLPKLFEMLDKKQEREHERAMFDLQMKADQLRASAEMQKLEKEGELREKLSEIAALIETNKAQAQPLQKTGNKWLDALLVLAEALSATVRPVLTYWYCVAAYGTYKVATLCIILDSGADWKNAVTVLWTPHDHAVMLSIIGFWFVDRAIRKREGS